jgi:prepilin-type processing-associated H-X9-DG protein
MSTRSGLTRVELVVVLVMVAIVAGLFMFFVPRFQELANQRQCENNLRQIGVGILAYRDNVIPPALPAARIADRHATWAVEIAPFVGGRQAEPLREWDLSRPYAEQTEHARQAQLGIYYCPSRRGPGRNSASGDFADNNGPDARHLPGALSDYACAAGDGDPRFPWAGPKANGTIILGEILEKGDGDTIKRWRGRTDLLIQEEGDKSATVHVGKATGKGDPLHKLILERGTSQTILIGEKHVRPDGFGKAEEGDGSAYNGGRPASFSRIAGPKHGLARSIYGSVDLQNPIFGSYHPNLCHFLMADGSVRPIEVMMDAELLGQMIVREGSGIRD